MYEKAWCTCRVVILLIKPIAFLASSWRRRRSFVRSLFSDLSEWRSCKTFFLWKTSYSIAWKYRSVYGLGEWYAKSRTGKFRSGIVLTIFTNQFLLPKNGREKPGTGIKISRIPHYISLKFRIPRVAFQTLCTANYIEELFNNSPVFHLFFHSACWGYESESPWWLSLLVSSLEYAGLLTPLASS